MYHILERKVSETGRPGNWRDSGMTPIASYRVACETSEGMLRQLRRCRYEYRVVHSSRLNSDGTPIEKYIPNSISYPREIAL